MLEETIGAVRTDDGGGCRVELRAGRGLIGQNRTWRQRVDGHESTE